MPNPKASQADTTTPIDLPNVPRPLLERTLMKLDLDTTPENLRILQEAFVESACNSRLDDCYPWEGIGRFHGITPTGVKVTLPGDVPPIGQVVRFEGQTFYIGSHRPL